MKKAFLSSILCVSSIFAVSDPSKTYNYEVTPFASGILTDSKAGLKDDNYINLGISLAKNLNDSFIDQLELAYMRSDNVEYQGLICQHFIGQKIYNLTNHFKT